MENYKSPISSSLMMSVLKSSSQMAENRIPIITDQGTPDASISTLSQNQRALLFKKQLGRSVSGRQLSCVAFSCRFSLEREKAQVSAPSKAIRAQREREREIRRGKRNREKVGERIITMTLAKSMWRNFTFYTKRRDKMKILKVIEVNKNFVLL